MVLPWLRGCCPPFNVIFYSFYYSKFLGLFNVDGYEVVYPFKADSNNNKRELSTKIDGNDLYIGHTLPQAISALIRVPDNRVVELFL